MQQRIDVVQRWLHRVLVAAACLFYGGLILIVLVTMFLTALAKPALSAEVGIASVFYDRHVACPPYRINPYKLIGAAHKTLPCGTMVEVTNRHNGKVAVVPIVDKGPCTTLQCQRGPARIKRRIFDLLPTAAKLIGSDGLVTVSLRVVGQAE